MSSSISLPGVPPAWRGGSTPIDEEVDEGVRLCEFVMRMRLRNRIVVDALTTALDGDPVAGWRRFAEAEIRSLGREARENAKRAAALRDVSAGAEGIGRSPHDYRHLDAQLLDRRAQVGKRVARRLASAAGDHDSLLATISSTVDAAADEILSGAARLDAHDLAVLEERVSVLGRLLVAAEAPSRRRGRGR